jgi:hypothetical protein
MFIAGKLMEKIWDSWPRAILINFSHEILGKMLDPP